ncbi:DUF2254 domain-containing protein [Kocuria sediminis]|uniref:DUF2254 domain-containing protein n=1 Tax=Kocuria sediminis TaxID=1038857 RepID=A0A6N8GR96_9MICC|nr:DUF2254 domain-containing protein [Kocuria sediminis]MUN64790.1 DUF2254 domain-containing protein [Kocuria sediminis]
MRNLSGWWHRVAGAFWFVPALCLLAALLLAQAVVAIDRVLPDAPSSPWFSWVYAVGIDGSRSMLAAIGTSMLAVAATAFSITISVVATASSTYGPRLVRNFMADRGNQLVLGVLVATFLYALLVLRTIRSAGDNLAAPFVPHLAVNLAVVLAVADVALLVWFIHHIAASVQVDTLVHRVRRDFRAALERWHPEQPPEDATRTSALRPGGAEIPAGTTGYLVEADLERLRDLAADQDAVLELVPRVGDHLLATEPLARVWPEAQAEDLAEQVRRCLRTADARTSDQDVRFAQQQVVELAVRALSPGTNDPYTAINAIEELAAGIAIAVSRPAPANTLVHDGTARVHYRPVELEEIVAMPFDHIRPHALGYVPVLKSLIDLAARTDRATIHPGATGWTRDHIDVLMDEFRAQDPHPHDLQQVEQHLAHRRTDPFRGAGGH